MSPRSWGIAGPARVNNPVGKTGVGAGIALVASGITTLATGGDVADGVTDIVTGVLLAFFGVKVHRQPPEFRQPDDD